MHSLPSGPVIEKPWGREIWWAVPDLYAAKALVVMAGHSVSLQYHERKHETLYFLEGEALLRIGDAESSVLPGHVVMIPPRTLHRIRGISDLVVIEVSTPDLDDVVRVEDSYGRVVDSD